MEQSVTYDELVQAWIAAAREKLAWQIHDCDYDACSDWAKQRIDMRITGMLGDN